MVSWTLVSRNLVLRFVVAATNRAEDSSPLKYPIQESNPFFRLRRPKSEIHQMGHKSRAYRIRTCVTDSTPVSSIRRKPCSYEAHSAAKLSPQVS